MKFFVWLFICLVFPLWLKAQTHRYSTNSERAAIIQSSPEEVMQFLRGARASEDNRLLQLQAMELGLHYLREKVAKGLNIPVAELRERFQRDPSLQRRMLDEPMRRVYTEFTLLDMYVRQRNAYAGCEREFRNRGTFTKELPLTQNVFSNLATSCPVNESAYTHGTRTYTLHYEEGFIQHVTLPSFLVDDNVDDLLEVAERVRLNSYFGEERPEFDQGYPMSPSLEQFRARFPGKSLQELETLGVQTRLRAETYERILTNSLKTMLMMNHLGGKPLEQATDFAQRMVTRICKHCSRVQREEMVTRSVASVRSDAETNLAEYSPVGPQTIAQRLCSELRAAHYDFDVYTPRFRPSPLLTGAHGPGRFSAIQVNGYKERIRAENMRILQNMARIKNGGVLFMTNAMNALSASGSPDQTKLKCTPQSLAEDSQMVEAATKEAGMNVLEYVDKFHEHINPDKTSEAQLQKDIKYLVNTNPSAVGEAMGSVEGAGEAACQAVYGIAYDEREDDFRDTALVWGSAVVALGLTIALPPAGVAAGSFLSLAVAATPGVAVGVGSLAYTYHEMNEEKEFADILRDASVTQEGNALVQARADEHYREYQQLRTGMLIEAGFLAADVLLITRAAYKLYGGMPGLQSRFRLLSANSFIRRLPQRVKRDLIELGMLRPTFNPKSHPEMLANLRANRSALLAKSVLTPNEVAEAQVLGRLLQNFGESGTAELQLLVTRSLGRPSSTAGAGRATPRTPEQVPPSVRPEQGPPGRGGTSAQPPRAGSPGPSGETPGSGLTIDADRPRANPSSQVGGPENRRPSPTGRLAGESPTPARPSASPSRTPAGDDELGLLVRKYQQEPEFAVLFADDTLNPEELAVLLSEYEKRMPNMTPVQRTRIRDEILEANRACVLE